jgi:peptidoglycan-N-acetylglucosamine deacetylase
VRSTQTHIGVRVERSAVLTTSWDDGHPLDQRIAELLFKYGLTGTFYVPMKNSRAVMCTDEVRRLSEVFEVGAHTVNHVVLTDVPERTAEQEIFESKRRLEDLTGCSCIAFCFPRGRFGNRHLDMLRRARFCCARTVELLSTQFPALKAGIDIIPTTVQSVPHHWTDYLKNSAKRFSSGNLINGFFHGRMRNWAEIAREMLKLVVRRGGVFHLWGHSWEVEEQQQWSQLETVLREMHGVLGSVRCVTNSGLLTSKSETSTATYSDCTT